mgnify:CR=1 FL=1
MDTESFQGDYTVTGILSNVGEKEANTCAIAVSKAALTQWAGFDLAGYRAYVHFQNDGQLSEEVMTARCREIAAQYGLPHVGMNSSYFAHYSKSIDFAATGGVAALALIGGYVVIQSIFHTGLSLIRFFRLCIRSCPAEKRTASSGEIPAAIFTGAWMEMDTMNQQARTVRRSRPRSAWAVSCF